MARAVWKGPFVEESLMKKVDKYKADPKKILRLEKQEDQDGLEENRIQEELLKTQLITLMVVVKVNQLEEDIQFLPLVNLPKV
jgi:ribosomal protein S19